MSGILLYKCFVKDEFKSHRFDDANGPKIFAPRGNVPFLTTKSYIIKTTKHVARLEAAMRWLSMLYIVYVNFTYNQKFAHFHTHLLILLI